MTAEKTDKPALIANVRETVRKAHEVVGYLHASLVKGGFAGGAESYRRMAGLVLTQELWARREAPGSLTEDFARLGREAAEVQAILLPYLESMQRLATLGASDDPPAAEPRPAAEAEAAAPAGSRASEALFAALRRRPSGASLTWLCGQVRLPRREVQQALDELVEAGSVRRRRSSGRAIFSVEGRGADRTA